jgi:putative ABC transport system permease protein
MNLNKLAFNNIRRRKLRSFLTMLGIIIGVATIVVLVGTTAGATTALKDETNEYMYDIMISPSVSSGSYLMDSKTVSKVNKLSQIYDIKELTTFQEYIGSKMVTVVGTNDWKSVKLKKGSQGVVIDESIAEKGHAIGSKIKIKNQELTITGITDADGAPVFINQDTAKKIAGNKVSAISARTHADPKKVAKEVRKQVDGISVETKSQKVAEVQEMTNKSLLFVGIIASVALLVGIISVINTMLISVMERTKELGILKAIGFTNWELKGSILFESGLIGFFGSIIGVILGVLGSIAIANVMEFTEYIPLMTPAWLIIGAIVGATLLSILAGLYPAVRASKLNVVEALRNE